jgi:hypothetical protein
VVKWVRIFENELRWLRIVPAFSEIKLAGFITSGAGNETLF